MDKVEVNGKNKEPLYDWLRQSKKQLGMKKIKWNFEVTLLKFILKMVYLVIKKIVKLQ